MFRAAKGVSPCRRRNSVVRETHAEGTTASAAPTSPQPGTMDTGGLDPKYAQGVRPPWQGPFPGCWSLEHGIVSIHRAVLLGGIPARSWRLPGVHRRRRVQGFDPDQPPALTRRTHASAVLLFWRSLGINTHRRRDTGLLPHQGPTVRELALSYPVREKAEMPDALEPTR